MQLTIVAFICLFFPFAFAIKRFFFSVFTSRCSVDSTYRPISSGSWYRARFTFKAFMFLQGTDSVYLQCKALICPASESNSRCRRGCSRRKARELEPKHESQTLVMGPIQLKSKNLSQFVPCSALNTKNRSPQKCCDFMRKIKVEHFSVWQNLKKRRKSLKSRTRLKLFLRKPHPINSEFL